MIVNVWASTIKSHKPREKNCTFFQLNLRITLTSQLYAKVKNFATDDELNLDI